MALHPDRGRAGRAGFLPARTVHLHPLDRCNLACSHCYSGSSPQKSTILPVAPLIEALPALRREGYEVISLSGGEPLLYPHLPALLAAAAEQGFRTAAITNGFRVAPRHRDLIGKLDRIAVSFDGLEALHNRIRGNPQAWDRAIQALRYLAEIGRPGAVAFTVSPASLAEVPDFVELCAGLGVRSVQLRPLVMAGRAPEAAADLALGPADALRLWLMARTLALAWAGEVDIHVDLAPAEHLAADTGAWDLALRGGDEPLLSDLANPLVITPEGRLRPYTYDFPPEYDLGQLGDLHPARRVWIEGGLPRLRHLLARSLQAVALEDGVIDWFAYQRDQARARHRVPA